MIQIYPSLLVHDLPTLLSQLHHLESTFSHFQIDFADGKYVESKTIEIDELLTSTHDFEFLKNGKHTIEFHLMVEDFTTALQKIDQLSAIFPIPITRVFIHLEPFQKANYIIPNTKYPVYLSVNPNEDIAENYKILRSFAALQLMSVQPGKQGGAFTPETLLKVNQLRDLGYDGEISLDGAMNDQTFPLVLKNKHLPNAICPGSYFVKNEPHEALKRLRDMEETSVKL